MSGALSTDKFGAVMAILRNIIQFWSHGNSTPEFHRAQHAILVRQIPLMYTILVVNIATLSIMHFGKAPDYLTIFIPSVISLICVLRTVQVTRARYHVPLDDTIRRNLGVTIALAALLGAVICTWSLVLFTYGDAYTKGQVTFFNGITIVAIITCLMPLRQLPLIMFGVVVVPTGLFLMHQNEGAFHAIAINMILVIAAMAVVLRRAHTDFRRGVEKQSELDRQRQELQSLHDTVSLLANEDSLTGLPNRRSFFERLDQLIDSDGGGRKSFAVGLIDLDGFKPVNDVLGHGAGDKLLREVGRRLKSGIPDNGMIARLGGDEFAIILPDAGGDEDILALGRSLLARLKPRFNLDEGSTTISATCGIARYPDAGSTGAELFERADFALYYSKEHDRGAATLFSDSHRTAIMEAATLGQRLRDADFDTALHLEYQPIVDARTGDTQGLEALARWTDPVLGCVPPDVFIRAAEQTGCIGRVTLALFRKALKTAATWPENLYLSFNLSAHDLCSAETMAAIVREIGDAGFPIRRLVFEITESAIMQDFARAVGALNELRSAGAAIALDDFGTGYSSLSYVHRLPIDRIKVDRSFVLDIEKEQTARNILKTISDLCRNLRLQCIIEGVETHSQLAILTQNGNTAYQGFLFARPMTEDRIAAYLNAETNRRQVG